MKHKLSFIVALWWVILCLIGGVFLLGTSDKQPRLSESENRMLAGFPKLSAASLASGEFMTGFESFLSDAFFGRDALVRMSDRLLGAFSALSRDDKLAAAANDMENRLQSEGVTSTQTPVPEATVQPAPADETAPPAAGDDDAEDDASAPEGDAPLTAEHSYLWLRRTDGTNKLLYTYDLDKISAYADTLRLIRTHLPEDGDVFFTQVPLASIANRWTDQQDTYCGWGSTVETMLESCLAGEEHIKVFNTFAILEPHMTEGTPLFYHTDHHWSAEGAYIVLSEMLKSSNRPVVPYDEYEYKAIRSKPNDAGQTDVFNVLYPLLPARSLIVTQRTEETELPLMNYDSSTYTAYMNNSRRPWRRVITGANTGRRALVICDSFGNAFAPYLLPYYDEVHMTDFRNDYYNKREAGGSIGELMEYHQIDDVYIVTSTANGLRKDNSIVYLRKYLEE